VLLPAWQVPAARVDDDPSGRLRSGSLLLASVYPAPASAFCRPIKGDALVVGKHGLAVDGLPFRLAGPPVAFFTPISRISAEVGRRLGPDHTCWRGIVLWRLFIRGIPWPVVPPPFQAQISDPDRRTEAASHRAVAEVRHKP
jgi:hypothetical protein